MVTVKTVVKTVAQNGLFADFLAEAASAAPGSGMQVNMSVQSASPDDDPPERIPLRGLVCAYTRDHAFSQPEGGSYDRPGKMKA